MRALLVMGSIMGVLLPAAYAADESPAKAAKESIDNPSCFQENITLSINFNIDATSFMDAKKKFAAKMQQLNMFAEQQHIQNFHLQSRSYNINSQVTNINGMAQTMGYQVNGNASYVLDSSDSAFKLGEFLSQEKMQVSVGVNQSPNGSCAN